MRNNLEKYEISITAIGPVFVGNGRDISKKEYLFLKSGQVAVLDIEKLYQLLCRRGLRDRYEDYMLGNYRMSLNEWLIKNRVSESEALKCQKYTLKNAEYEGVPGRSLQVMEFVKDAYGMPYVPGSSIKGMLRTILLGAELCKNPQKFSTEKHQLEADLARGKGRRILARNIQQIEAVQFRTLIRNQKKPEDAVNDIFAGLIVGDSRPLLIEDLVLCQKIERNIEGHEKRLNLLRECLKPGTKICAVLTIDKSLCRLSTDEIREAIAIFNSQYYENFSQAFGMDRPKKDNVFLGGGSGFLSKTIIYPMFGKRKGVVITKDIFEKTGVSREHKHAKDPQLGVSPHIIKCTRYRGKTLQMGLCQCEITEDFAAHG